MSAVTAEADPWRSTLGEGSIRFLSALMLAVLLGLLPLHGDTKPGVQPGTPISSVTQEQNRDVVQPDELWSPGYLFSSNTTLFRVVSQTTLMSISADEGTVTGMTSAPAGDRIIFSVSHAGGSHIVSLYMGGSGKTTVMDADALGVDMWFHGPLSLSPDKRWLLASVSTGRNSFRDNPPDPRCFPPGDLWLVDSDGIVAPRQVAQAGTLLSCNWSLSADRVVCEWLSAKGDSCSVFLLDVATAKRRNILDESALATWLLDGTLQLRVRATSQVVLCRVVAGQLEIERRTDFAAPQSPTPGGLWSYFGEIGAWISPGTGQKQLWIAPAAGPSRMVALEQPVRRLCAWSDGGRLLAFATADNRIGVSVGPVNEAERERAEATCPPPFVVEGEGSPVTISVFGTITQKTPLSVPCADLVFATWITWETDLCLLYVVPTDAGQQTVLAVRFAALSLRDLGLDPQEDIREQIILQEAESDFSQLWAALNHYAADHDGKFPPNESGPKLVEDLKDYADPQVLSTAYAPDKLGLRLLMPGKDFHALLWDHTIRERHRIPIAIMNSDDSCVFVLYADGHIEQVRPVRRIVDQPPYPQLQSDDDLLVGYDADLPPNE